jgi:hypothetical protein
MQPIGSGAILFRDQGRAVMTFFHDRAKKVNQGGTVKKTNRTLLIFCLLLSWPVISEAFVHYIRQDSWEEESVNIHSERIPFPMDSWNEFVSRYGSRWKIDWDEALGTPRAIYGSSIEMFPGGILSGGFMSDKLLSFVDENRFLFGISSAELRTVNAEKHGRFWYVNYQQISNSVPVYGSRVQFRLRGDGKLVAVSARLHHEIDTISTPGLSVESVEARVKREVFFDEGIDRAMDSRLVVYPHKNANAMRYTLSWMVELITLEPPAHWFYVVDAVTGEVVDKWNQIYYDEVPSDTIFGVAKGTILPETPTNDPEMRFFKDLLVELQSGGSDVTDSAGIFIIERANPGQDSIFVELLGPFVNVDNDSSPDGVIRMEALIGSSNPVVWDDMNTVIAERNGFYHTVVAHDYVKAIDPSYTGLDYMVPCRVNLDQTCNAFWDGFGMNFFRAGGGCANTANIADVIYHEYGHGVTDYQYRPFPQPSGAMHEGFSDYIAATITNQSLIGRGFTGPGSWLRNTENSRIWPAPECGGEPHCVGEVIAGALWDMRQNLIASLGQEVGVALSDSLFHYARYGLSTTFPDYFIDLLMVDDDDGDLSNGIPHAEEICGGFENHGLSCVLTPNAPLIFDVGNGTDLLAIWQPSPQLMAPITDYFLFYGLDPRVYSDSISNGVDTTIVVTNLIENQTYYFALVAEDSTGRRSPLSQEVTAVPLSIPLPPKGVQSSSHTNGISLSWFQNGELDLDGYVVSRSVFIDSAYSDLATVANSETTYVDQTPDPHVMYYYRVSAKDTDGLVGDPSDAVRGRLMSLDGGILVIDGTRDGQNGPPYTWSDSTVDNFYTNILDRYPVSAEYDIADSLETALFLLDDAILSLYSTVVWHQDDRLGDELIPYLDAIGSYLSEGGSLFLSGWQLINQLSDASSGPVTFPSGSVPHDYLKLNSGEILLSTVRDFIGADTRVGDYPDLMVDSTKAWLFEGNLFEMEIIDEPLVGEPITEAIYSYRSSNGDTATYNGEVVALRYLGEDYRLVVFDFPLFYMEVSSAEQAMDQVMADLEEMVGVAGDEGGGITIPRAFALHQNYPNPFNPSTSIVIDVPVSRIGNESARVQTKVAIYNVRGQLIRLLLDEDKEPGRYMLNWDGRNNRGERVGSGLYLYRMEAGDFVSTRKMVLLK